MKLVARRCFSLAAGALAHCCNKVNKQADKHQRFAGFFSTIRGKYLKHPPQRHMNNLWKQGLQSQKAGNMWSARIQWLLFIWSFVCCVSCGNCGKCWGVLLLKIWYTVAMYSALFYKNLHTNRKQSKRCVPDRERNKKSIHHQCPTPVSI